MGSVLKEIIRYHRKKLHKPITRTIILEGHTFDLENEFIPESYWKHLKKTESWQNYVLVKASYNYFLSKKVFLNNSRKHCSSRFKMDLNVCKMYFAMAIYDREKFREAFDNWKMYMIDYLSYCSDNTETLTIAFCSVLKPLFKDNVICKKENAYLRIANNCKNDYDAFISYYKYWF